MNISIVGNGYVGLTVAVGFASKGHRVICIDTDEAKVRQINRGESPVHEANLDALLSSCVTEEGSLKASLDYNDILSSDITFICVGTPCNSDGAIDLSYIRHSATGIGQVLARGDNHHIVVVKSTVTPGTTEGVIIPILEEHSSKKAGRDFGIAVNPEFFQEGKSLHCFLYPDRTIVGEHDPRVGDVLQEIYRDFPAPILRTDIKTAEMIKYVSNTFLATKVSFVNEIGNICKKLGVDVYEVARGIGYDPRIGDEFLNAGIGFGGSCLPKDLEALISKAGELDYKAELLRSVLQVNREQPLRLVEIARRKLGSLGGKVITVLGLAFKPDTNDLRRASSLEVIAQLLEAGTTVKVYDPMAMPNARQVLSDGVTFCDSAPDAIAGSDCVIIVTEWDEFKDESLYVGKFVIDGRRTLNPERARQLCQYYEGLCW